jgi:hypothetical protein
MVITLCVLLGYGYDSFVTQTNYLSGIRPSSVAVGDMNKGILLPIVVANSVDNRISVLLGYFTAAFFKQKMVISGNGSRSRSLVMIDLNNDNIGIFLGYGNIGLFKYFGFYRLLKTMEFLNEFLSKKYHNNILIWKIFFIT